MLQPIYPYAFRSSANSLLQLQLGGLRWVSGRWYGASGTGPSYAIGVTYAEDRIYFVPIPILKGQGINSIGIECVSISGTCGIRLGIWDEENGLPMNCIVDSGDLNIAAGGWKEVDYGSWARGDSNPFLYTGWYFLGFQWSTNTGTGIQFRATDQDTSRAENMMGIADSPIAGAHPAVACYIAGASVGDLTTAFSDAVNQSTIAFELTLRAPRPLVQAA